MEVVKRAVCENILIQNKVHSWAALWRCSSSSRSRKLSTWVMSWGPPCFCHDCPRRRQSQRTVCTRQTGHSGQGEGIPRWGPRATERMGEFKGAFWKDPVYWGVGWRVSPAEDMGAEKVFPEVVGRPPWPEWRLAMEERKCGKDNVSVTVSHLVLPSKQCEL